VKQRDDLKVTSVKSYFYFHKKFVATDLVNKALYSRTNDHFMSVNYVHTYLHESQVNTQ